MSKHEKAPLSKVRKLPPLGWNSPARKRAKSNVETTREEYETMVKSFSQSPTKSPHSRHDFTKSGCQTGHFYSACPSTVSMLRSLTRGIVKFRVLNFLKPLKSPQPYERLVPVEIDSNETVETCDTLPLPRITSTPQVAKITKVCVPLETPIAAPPPPPMDRLEEESVVVEKEPEVWVFVEPTLFSFLAFPKNVQ